VVAHFSTRYQEGEVRQLVERKLPPVLRDRVLLWI
jgi:hypothetical protein